LNSNILNEKSNFLIAIVLKENVIQMMGLGWIQSLKLDLKKILRRWERTLLQQKENDCRIRESVVFMRLSRARSGRRCVWKRLSFYTCLFSTSLATEYFGAQQPLQHYPRT